MKLHPLKSFEEMEREYIRRNRSTCHSMFAAIAVGAFIAFMLTCGPEIIQGWLDANSPVSEDFGPDHWSY